MRLTVHAALAAAIAAFAFATPARSNDAPAQTAQPAQKPVEIAAEKDTHADVRRDDTHAAREPQTHKMVRCNEEAGKKQLRGDERRAFMSACLKA